MKCFAKNTTCPAIQKSKPQSHDHEFNTITTKPHACTVYKYTHTNILGLLWMEVYVISVG